MSDIVKSLRQASLNQGDYRWKAADEIERLRCREKDITLEGLALIGRIEQTREALAGTDAASLPRDYPLERMAQDRMAENERLRAALRLLHDNVVTAWPSVADLGPVANARAELEGK